MRLLTFSIGGHWNSEQCCSSLRIRGQLAQVRNKVGLQGRVHSPPLPMVTRTGVPPLTKHTGKRAKNLPCQGRRGKSQKAHAAQYTLFICVHMYTGGCTVQGQQPQWLWAWGCGAGCLFFGQACWGYSFCRAPGSQPHLRLGGWDQEGSWWGWRTYAAVRILHRG